MYSRSNVARRQICYNGVRLLGEGPSPRNVARLDFGARPMLHAMMTRGIQIDPDHFRRMDSTLTDDMDRVTEEIRQAAGHYVNPGSGDQVAHFLFKELGLDPPRRKFTPSGKRESVENDVLVSIQHAHPVVSKFLDYKEYEKLRGTYARPIPKLAVKINNEWRLLPWLKDTRIPSGRFSCDEPNLLAMPNRTARGRELLNGFITRPGWRLLSVDESQIEPRTLAHRSQDERLMSIYRNREDIYSDHAIGAFKLEDKRYQDEHGKWQYPGVDKKKHRFPSKTCVLAWIYRVTEKGLLDQMPVLCANCGVEAGKHDAEVCDDFVPYWNEDNCRDLITTSNLQYPRVAQMQRMDDARARRHTYVWDDFGRFLHTTAVRSVHPWVVSAALREAGNMPIQGFACGTLKLVMAAVMDDFTRLSMYRDVWYPLLPIHDEILSEVREDLVEEIGEHIAWRFRTCVQLSVPLEAEYASAPSWGQILK